MMSSLCFSGCDEINTVEYITVTVFCDVFAYAKYANDPYSNIPVIDAVFDVSIVKDGCERVEKSVKTGSGEKAESVSKTFKLYNKQPIVCHANIRLESVESN